MLVCNHSSTSAIVNFLLLSSLVGYLQFYKESEPPCVNYSLMNIYTNSGEGKKHLL